VVQIRDARPEEFAEVGALTAAVYLEVGLVRADSGYLVELRDAPRRARQAQLVVAADGGRVVGSVTFALPGSEYAELAGPGEAEFRMLVVDPAVRGRGLGALLVAECLRRAREAGAGTVRLSTAAMSAPAHRLYERLGFARTPDRDWSPAPGYLLLTYAAPAGWCDRCGEPLAAGGHAPCRAARDLEPPRWCGRCRRRMVVQVTPTGWTARCAEHGTRHG
jgi:ribosomal protein S18 acetylase RimI-like enzyme